MIIDYNNKIKVPNPRPHFNGGNIKPKSTLGQCNPKPQQVPHHENDHPPDNTPTETLEFWNSVPAETGELTFHAYLHESNPAEQDWKSLGPYIGWQSEQFIQRTYKEASRFGRTVPQHDDLKKHFKSRDPVFNIPRRNEPVATNTVFSDTPAIHDGSTMAQFFFGKDTLVCDAYEIKSQKQFINTLYDNIKTRGAMDTSITDGGNYEISNKGSDLLRSLFIKQYESEPYHQHQNKAEQCYGVVKRYINALMNLTGAPSPLLATKPCICPF